MMAPIVIIALAALVILGLAGGAQRPVTATPGRVLESAKRVYDRYRTKLEAYPSPMPPGALGYILWHESGGNPATKVISQVTGGSEIGLALLTVEHSGHSGEAQLADVDPLDATASIYGVQHEYARLKDRFAAVVREAGFPVPGDDQPDAWISILHLGRSIGPAGVDALIRQAKGHGTTVPEAWGKLAGSGTLPKIGRQSPELVAKRVRNALALPAKAAALAPLPARLGGPPVRGADVPHFDRAKLKAAGVPMEDE